MKRLLIISYWVVSILLVAILLSSLGYRFVEAVFIGTMFLPGALAAKYFFPKVEYRNRRAGVKNTVYIVLGILVAEMLLFLLAHYYVTMYRKNISEWTVLPEILTNPIFIAMILTMLATGCYFFESWLNRKRPTPPAPVTFTSFRKPVTLRREEILYVESNDNATSVVATDGRRFKNITPISQWEASLKPQFIRIHRSYLVNKDAVTGVDVDLLNIGDIQLPISRKYKDRVAELFS
ncbi:MAG: LytTR family transcriptional regulator [Bacteroidales bacterium]|nr:LytTR family transcriptional regulator [Bacteroidales bacterium]